MLYRQLCFAQHLLLVTAFFLCVAPFSGAQASSDATRCMELFSKYEAKHNIPRNLLQSIGLTESGRTVSSVGRKVAWPWTVNAEGKGYYFTSKWEAIHAVHAMFRKGMRSIDVGCMQINLKYHPKAFKNLTQAFEPSENIGYAARLLKRHFNKKKSWKHAVAAYHSERWRHGRRYAHKVLKKWRKTSRNHYQATHIAHVEVKNPKKKSARFSYKLAQIKTITPQQKPGTQKEQVLEKSAKKIEKNDATSYAQAELMFTPPGITPLPTRIEQAAILSNPPFMVD